VKEHYTKYYSHHLGRDINLLIFGDSGIPILIFPTTLGAYYQAKDMGLIASIQHFVNEGKFKIYCIDSIDADSWYAKHLIPEYRVYNHILYDKFLQHELIPFIQKDSHHHKIGISGCSFGGYHAANYTFRHPEHIDFLITMSGAFNITNFLDGHYNDNVYFNNPVDYMANEEAWKFNQIKIILGTSNWDICLQSNIEMSSILNSIGLEHWLDIWGNEVHDWPLWNRMFPYYLSKIL
jgi:esterase/lipase superfamily enzyme